jgi:hypothetical protein
LGLEPVVLVCVDEGPPVSVVLSVNSGPEQRKVSHGGPGSIVLLASKNWMILTNMTVQRSLWGEKQAFSRKVHLSRAYLRTTQPGASLTFVPYEAEAAMAMEHRTAMPSLLTLPRVEKKRATKHIYYPCFHILRPTVYHHLNERKC